MFIGQRNEVFCQHIDCLQVVEDSGSVCYNPEGVAQPSTGRKPCE